MAAGPRVLTLDIESSPHLCWSFQTWKTNISPIQIVEPTRMLCFAAKWLDSKKVHFHSEFDGEGVDEYNHGLMVQEAWDLLDEADVVVTYNGDRYDLPHLNREFLLAGLKAPSPYASVDLYKVMKRETIFASHKLSFITQQLSLSGKLENSGFGLWLNVLSDDPEVAAKAWREMTRYNKRDVVTTEEAFLEVRHLVKNMPSVSLFEGGDFTGPHCELCGSTDLVKQGFKYTKTRRYQQYRCNGCGSWFRDTRSDKSTPIT